MRIGIVTKWFSSGQATVARYLRSAFDELGHESFVLARPGKGPRAGALETDDPIWDQPGVTYASRQEVPPDEYARWAADNRLDAVFLDNTYEFDDIRAGLRDNGVATVGRFVWEHFSSEDAAPAADAFDVIYSLTAAEQDRYREMGIDSVPVRWGCHPELTSVVPRRDPETVTMVWPGSFMGRRKPLDEALEAFGRVPDQHLRPFANCDVCLTPSRWEGLGLPLYEATAFGMPIITNDNPPMNEIVEDGFNGLLVSAHPDGETRSGLTAYTPDVDDLARAIERAADDELRSRLAE